MGQSGADTLRSGGSPAADGGGPDRPAPQIDLAGPAVHHGRWISDRAGTVLGGRYELIEQCGTGGMAAVYRARDSRLGREVAVKVPAPQYAQRPEFAERFRREAQAAAGLNHPNVVAVYDWGHDADAGVHYLVMELVRGPSLRELLRARGALPEAQALRVADEVAAALQAAHEEGIVHRDVKPPNILFDQSGRAKVTDFGIARAASWQQITETTTVMGTARYLSPEQADMRPVDHRADLYSLGIVLYEMLTGRLPFDGDSPVAIALRQIRDAPEPPRRLRPDLSPAAESIVLRALEKDPAARFASAAEMRAELERARAGAGAPADSPTWPVEPPGAAPGRSDGAPAAPAPRPGRPGEPARSIAWPPTAARLLGRVSPPAAGWILPAGVLLLALALGAGLLIGTVGGARCAPAFDGLRARLPNGIGACLAAARTEPETGDLVQPTERGTLRLRRADGTALFASADQVWVDGPFGLQQRRDDERFAWESPTRPAPR